MAATPKTQRSAVTKTETVQAVEGTPSQQHVERVPFRDRLKRLQQETLALGTPDPDFNEKAFCDEMWGHEPD